MTPYREQVALALRAVAVKSATSYAWFGHVSRPLLSAPATEFPSAALRTFLVLRLESELYGSFYSRGRPVPHQLGEAPSVRPDPSFVAALSASNAGRGGWEPGWHVETVEGDARLVVRDGLRVRALDSECRPLRAAPGAPVSVRRPKEQRAVSPGFYFALGDADRVDLGDAMEVRVYFHVTAAGAAPLIANATRLLNEAGLPFSIKVLNHPAGFTRCDAAVLYLRRRDFEPARAALREVVSACRPHLRGDAPAFTKPLGRGVAVGEHLPSHGESFGMSRCRLLAEGIVAAHERRAASLDDRVYEVARCFAGRGLDVDLPYLAPGSRDDYAL